MPETREEAYELVEKLGAPGHLKTHVALVGEAADLIIQKLDALGVRLDFDFIRAGVAIHDIGKVVHVQEMTGPGSRHEPEGEKLLIENGVAPALARVCLSHARWRERACSLEELVIALADNLWKGKRIESLELAIIDQVADLLDKERWDVFPDLDSTFEEIAAGGHDRLQRSTSR